MSHNNSIYLHEPYRLAYYLLAYQKIQIKIEPYKLGCMFMNKPNLNTNYLLNGFHGLIQL